ncbi:MAG: DNA-deoxyinosine glycosylase [Gammaproteobacteria bacterium]|nr:MAG: DNA-deoxyinosine glycosylase [Gammaproteobacteria bacterium]
MPLIRGFAPLVPEKPHLLILGSMPGQPSLNAREYYANRQNAFWPIIVALSRDEQPDRERAFALSYRQRCTGLAELGIALWDVLAHCRRVGSLDAAIERDSEFANDIAALLHEHPSIHTLCFNGQTAARLFRRHFGEPPSGIGSQTLPSTSPAYASLSLDEKYKQWRDALGLLQR